MGISPTQPLPAEGAPDEHAPDRPSAPTQPEPAEGDDALPGEQPGSPAG